MERSRPGSEFPQQHSGDFAVFISWCSVYQPPPPQLSADSTAAEAERPSAERDAYERALVDADIWFAHLLCRLVVLDVPAGWSGSATHAERGWPTFELNCHALAKQLHGPRQLPVLLTAPTAPIRSRVPAPRSARAFTELLAARKFGVESDREVVSKLYTATLERILGGIDTLNFGGLGWSDDDCEALAEVLQLCTQARSLNLSRNAKIGDRGVCAIVKALQAGAAPRIREVYLQHLPPFGPDGSNALRAISRVRDTNI
jgi:hypothetical protein